MSIKKIILLLLLFVMLVASLNGIDYFNIFGGKEGYLFFEGVYDLKDAYLNTYINKYERRVFDYKQTFGYMFNEFDEISWTNYDIDEQPLLTGPNIYQYNNTESGLKIQIPLTFFEKLTLTPLINYERGNTLIVPYTKHYAKFGLKSRFKLNDKFTYKLYFYEYNNSLFHSSYENNEIKLGLRYKLNNDIIFDFDISRWIYFSYDGYIFDYNCNYNVFKELEIYHGGSFCWLKFSDKFWKRYNYGNFYYKFNLGLNLKIMSFIKLTCEYELAEPFYNNPVTDASANDIDETEMGKFNNRTLSIGLSFIFDI